MHNIPASSDVFHLVHRPKRFSPVVDGIAMLVPFALGYESAIHLSFGTSCATDLVSGGLGLILLNRSPFIRAMIFLKMGDDYFSLLRDTWADGLAAVGSIIAAGAITGGSGHESGTGLAISAGMSVACSGFATTRFEKVKTGHNQLRAMLQCKINRNLLSLPAASNDR
jgi:hypothetical protein